MFKDWDEFNWLAFFATVVVTVVIISLTVGIFHKKELTYYYLDQTDSNHTATCVYANWEWDSNEVVFCTNDINEALDVVNRANANLKAK